VLEQQTQGIGLAARALLATFIAIDMPAATSGPTVTGEAPPQTTNALRIACLAYEPRTVERLLAYNHGDFFRVDQRYGATLTEEERTRLGAYAPAEEEQTLLGALIGESATAMMGHGTRERRRMIDTVIVLLKAGAAFPPPSRAMDRLCTPLAAMPPPYTLHRCRLPTPRNDLIAAAAVQLRRQGLAARRKRLQRVLGGGRRAPPRLPMLPL
jgi:hypothetical protein